MAVSHGSVRGVNAGGVYEPFVCAKLSAYLCRFLCVSMLDAEVFEVRSEP